MKLIYKYTLIKNMWIKLENYFTLTDSQFNYKLRFLPIGATII